MASWKTSELLFVMFTLSSNKQLSSALTLRWLNECTLYIYMYVCIYSVRTSRTTHFVNNRKVKSVSDSLKNWKKN